MNKKRILSIPTVLTVLCFALVLALTLFCVPTEARAATEGYYTYTVSNGEATITDCVSNISGDVTIPSTLGGCPVVAIGKNAFAVSINITSVIIPDGVTVIGESAFSLCGKMNSVTIPDSVTAIGKNAFQACAALTEVTIPASVTTIGDNAFYYCTSLTGVWVSENNSAYSSDENGILFDKNKTALLLVPGTVSGSYTVPNGVTAIGTYAFYNCRSNLIDVTLPDSLTAIGEGAFYGCTGLTVVTIPEGVTTVGAKAFYDCKNLTDVTLPGSLRSIGESAFRNCTGLTAVTIPDGVKTIGKEAFGYCTGLTGVTIPASVTAVGDNAFYNCTGLTGVYISDVAAWCRISFSQAASNPLMYCGTLYLHGEPVVELLIPNGATTVGDFAFYNYSSLIGVTIPDSVTSIGKSAFAACKNLTDVTIPGSVAAIGESAFSGCSALTDVTIRDGVTSLGNSAFYNCTALNAVMIPDSVTVLEKGAFRNCSSLTDITIPGSIAAIGNGAFSYCSGLTNVTIQEGVTAIGKDAFRSCYKLTQVSIPYSVTSIDSYAFVSDSKLQSVYYHGTEETWGNISIASENTYLTRAKRYYEDHVFTKYDIVQEPTCGLDASKCAKCDICGTMDVKSEVGTATGLHSFVDYVSNGDGTEIAKCENCHVTDTRSVFLTQPENVTVNSGQTAQFTVSSNREIVSYKWEYRRYHVWFGVDLEGSDTGTLTIPATGAVHGLDYRCFVTFADGTRVYTEIGELTVLTEITGITNPTDQTVFLGEKALFTASAEGEGIRYRWQYQRPNGKNWYYTTMEGYQKPTVMIKTTAARDGYKYRCEITDVTGKTVYTEAATMRVQRFTGHPADVFAAPNADVQFAVKLYLTDDFTYQWQYSSDGGNSWSDSTLNGYNTDTLTLEADEARNGYQYRCVVTDAGNCTAFSKAASLHVGDSVNIINQPASFTGAVDTNAVFTVKATDVYSYQWQYRRSATGSWYDTAAEGNKTEEVTVAITSGRDGYQYRCIITGLDGQIHYTDIATLTVN